MVLDVPEIMDQYFRHIQVQPVKTGFLLGLLISQIGNPGPAFLTAMLKVGEQFHFRVDPFRKNSGWV